MNESARTTPLVICILDGFGEAAPSNHNAIASANTPNIDALRANYPAGLIDASAGAVGLPSGQMGNSEVGHMNLGAGRVVMQDLPRIDAAITSGELANNAELVAHIAALKQSGGTCHLMGLCSDGGVHAHLDHIIALANIVADAGVPVAIHALLDGRDTPPESAGQYIDKLEALAKERALITFATVSGRYYAMDRDKRYERVAKAYDAMVAASGLNAQSARQALEQAASRGETDEFVQPAVIGDYAGMQDGDGLIMANFRADRARQMLHALCDPAFDGFARSRTVSFAHALGMVEYSQALNAFVSTMFPPQTLHDTFGEVLAKAGLKQLRIAETEKYAHVTFFFNGGREQEFDGEERILVPSPKVKTYDEKPEMSAFEVAEKLVASIEKNTHDVVIVNFANTDMVGHTGNFAAAVKAVEAVDQCVGQIVKAMESVGGAMLLTADHGNAEAMHDHDNNQAHTQHTLNLVPLIAVHPKLSGRLETLPQGVLADIAPTALAVLGVSQPGAMTGNNLLKGLL